MGKQSDKVGRIAEAVFDFAERRGVTAAEVLSEFRGKVLPEATNRNQRRVLGVARRRRERQAWPKSTSAT